MGGERERMHSGATRREISGVILDSSTVRVTKVKEICSLLCHVLVALFVQGT